jgi:hypothetical protein
VRSRRHSRRRAGLDSEDDIEKSRLDHMTCINFCLIYCIVTSDFLVLTDSFASLIYVTLSFRSVFVLGFLFSKGRILGEGGFGQEC